MGQRQGAGRVRGPGNRIRPLSCPAFRPRDGLLRFVHAGKGIVLFPAEPPARGRHPFAGLCRRDALLHRGTRYIARRAGISRGGPFEHFPGIVRVACARGRRPRRRAAAGRFERPFAGNAQRFPRRGHLPSAFRFGFAYGGDRAVSAVCVRPFAPAAARAPGVRLCGCPFVYGCGGFRALRGPQRRDVLIDAGRPVLFAARGRPQFPGVRSAPALPGPSLCGGGR